MLTTALPLFQTFSGNTWTGFSQTDDSLAFVSLEVGDLGSPSHIGKAKLEYILSHGLTPAQENQVKTAVLLNLTKQNAHFTLHGDARVIIIRNGQYTQIKESTSGILQPRDILVFTNQNTSTSPAWKSIKANLSGLSPELLERELLAHEKNPIALIVQVSSVYQESQTTPIANTASYSKPTSSRFSSKKTYLLFLVPLAIFLLAFLAKKVTTTISYAQSKQELEELLTKAEGIYPLNPSSAQATAQEAQDLLNTVRKQRAETWQDDYQSRINRLTIKPSKLAVSSPTSGSSNKETPTKANQSGSLGDAQPFFDASSIAQNINYSRIVGTSGKLFLLDTSSKRLDVLNLDTKNSENILKNNLLESAQILVANGPSIYLANSTNLYKVDSSSLASVLKFSSQDNSISPNSLAFWNNALYVLDTQGRQIYKYTPNTRGFDPAVAWLKPGQRLESDALGITIDTSLYLLSKTNLISQFSKGERNTFATSGATGIDNPTHFSVPVAGDKLVLVASNKAYIFDKSGKLLKTYSLGDTIPLDIALLDNTLYILESSQKIIKLPL